MKLTKLNYYYAIIFLILLTMIVYAPLHLVNNKIETAWASGIQFLDTALENYLLSLTDGQSELDYNSFAETETLIFENTAIASEILSISELGQLNWAKLSKIEVKGLLNLTNFDLGNNQSAFPQLKELSIMSNYNLSTIDISAIESLQNIKIVSNPNIVNLKLTKLDLCKNLTLNSISRLDNYLNLSGDFASLQTLDITDSESLQSIALTAPTQLVSAQLNSLDNLLLIKINNANNLTSILAKNLPSLESVNIIAPNLKQITFDELQQENIEIKKISSNNLKSFIFQNNNSLKHIDLSSSAVLEVLNLKGCHEIYSVILNQTLENLVTLNLYDLANLTTNINLSASTNLKILDLFNCKLLSDDFFHQITSLSNLIYLNLEQSSCDNIDLSNLPLKTLLLGNHDALTSINLTNLIYLQELVIANCDTLSRINITDLISLEQLQIYDCPNLEKVEITNTLLKNIELIGQERLNTLNLFENLSLIKLNLDSCAYITTAQFSDSTNLEEIEIINCPNLQATTTEQFSNFTKLRLLTIGNCDAFEELCLENCPNFEKLDISLVENLVNLKLNNLGNNKSNFQLSLPNTFKRLKTIELNNLKTAQLQNEELICSNLYVNKVILDNVNLKKIDFSNNLIVTISLKNMSKLENINLTNNKISRFPELIDDIDKIKNLKYVNLNGNRLDFTNETNLFLLSRSTYKEIIIVGLQNVLNKNNYTYYPTIFIGNIDNNIKLTIYHANNIIKSPNLKNIDLSAYHTVDYSQMHKLELSTGTYIFKFTKNIGGKYIDIEQGDRDYYNYISYYCNVSKEVLWISYIWIIFFIIAGCVFLFIIISYIVDKIKINKKRVKRHKKKDSYEENENYDDINEEVENEFISDNQIKSNNKRFKKEIENKNIQKTQETSEIKKDNKPILPKKPPILPKK